jgi:putative oxidoreductase
MRKAYELLIQTGNALQPLFLLAVRLFWGWHFFTAGWGKFHNVESTVSFFTELQIPFPLLSVYLAAFSECVGGLCLLIGFASRLAALPLIFTMVVALLTAHRKEVLAIFEDPTPLISESAFTYLCAALLIFVFGPGALSIDALIKRYIVKSK